MVSNLREQAASVLHNDISVCTMLITTEGYECRESILFSKLSSMNPPSLSPDLLHSLSPFSFLFDASDWCALFTPAGERPCGCGRLVCVCVCACHLGGNQGQRSSSEWLRVRDAALNDPCPRASLRAGWLSARAGHLLDTTPPPFCASSLHLGYGKHSQIETNPWFARSLTQRALSCALLYLLSYLCTRVCVCTWYTDKY